MTQSKLYEFTVTDNKGNEQSMAQYRGKVLLIVNTATACGFTPQYNDLDSLYDAYASRGQDAAIWRSHDTRRGGGETAETVFQAIIAFP